MQVVPATSKTIAPVMNTQASMFFLSVQRGSRKVERDHADDYQPDRHELDRGLLLLEIRETDYRDERRTHGRPHRVGYAEIDLFHGERQAAEAQRIERDQTERRLEVAQAVRELHAGRPGYLEKDRGYHQNPVHVVSPPSFWHQVTGVYQT